MAGTRPAPGQPVTAAEGRPALKPGCRLSPAGDVLLIPEGVLKLQGPASRILPWCDGKRTVSEIVLVLINQFPGADHLKMSQDISNFLTKLADRGAIEFV